MATPCYTKQWDFDLLTPILSQHECFQKSWFRQQTYCLKSCIKLVNFLFENHFVILKGRDERKISQSCPLPAHLLVLRFQIPSRPFVALGLHASDTRGICTSDHPKRPKQGSWRFVKMDTFGSMKSLIKKESIWSFHIACLRKKVAQRWFNYKYFFGCGVQEFRVQNPQLCCYKLETLAVPQYQKKALFCGV